MEVQRAVATLRDVLRPLDIALVLETREIDDATFETIPERILVRAALIAATQMLGDE